MSAQIPPPAPRPSNEDSAVPWPRSPEQAAELGRISREMDELAVELTRISARTRISIQAIRKVESLPDRDIYEWGTIQGFIGLERQPPHMPIVFHRSFVASEPGGGIFTLDGQPASESSTLLPEFCTLPLPHVKVQETGRFLTHFVEPLESARGSLDIVVGQRFRTSKSGSQRGQGPRISLAVRIPSRLLKARVFTPVELLVSDSPKLRMFHPGLRELPGGPEARWFDQLAELPPPQRSRPGQEPNTSRDDELCSLMAARMFQKLGWDQSTFIQHAVDVPLPIWGVEYMLDL